ncbi:MAG: hypothetical protein ABR589_12200 [Chthoniobacterales bacterium]
MRPIFEINRPPRRDEPKRPFGRSISKSPVTDWNFQTSTADLRGGPAPSAYGSERSLAGGFRALSQGFFEAETKWENRIEVAAFAIIVALAAWPVVQAVQTALRTV